VAGRGRTAAALRPHPERQGAIARREAAPPAGGPRRTRMLDIYNLPTGIVGAHIHVGPRGVNGPIIFNFTVPAVGQSNDFALSGSLTPGDLVARAAQGINSFEDAIFAIASGVTYVNIHTQANPGGEIRGQLCPENVNANTFSGVAVCTSR
jgi:hypothetical protein